MSSLHSASDIRSQDRSFETAQYEPSHLTAGGTDIPMISGVAALTLSLGLALIGGLGFAGTFSGPIFCWTVIGLSAAITVLSGGVLSPATIVTVVLGILGLTGTLPFATVGMATMITITAALLAGTCIIAKCD